MSTKKQEFRQGMTTRWTAEEKRMLDWLSGHIGVEVSNVPRTLLWQHFGANPDLQSHYENYIKTVDVESTESN